MKTLLLWIVLIGYMTGGLLLSIGLRWSFQSHVTELPILYWLVLMGGLLTLALTCVTQVLNRVPPVTYSPAHGLATMALGLLLITAPFIFQLPFYGWSGTGYITGGMVATASFGVFAVLVGLWTYRWGRTAAVASPG
jgi:hypothetical protein